MCATRRFLGPRGVDAVGPRRVAPEDGVADRAGLGGRPLGGVLDVALEAVGQVVEVLGLLAELEAAKGDEASGEWVKCFLKLGEELNFAKRHLQAEG